VREEVQEMASLAGEDPLVRAADRWRTLRKFAPALIEALQFRSTRAGDPMLGALKLLAGLNQSGKREVPEDAPMPFRKEWRRLVMEEGGPNRRLYETAVLATLRDKLRSGDVWVERSASYRRFDSYLLPPDAVPAVMIGLKLPATADEWLAGRAGELDRRLKRFSRRLLRGELEGVELRDGRLHVAPVKTTATPETRAFADGIEAMMPPARITELLYEVNRMTGFASAFTNLRTGERCDNENALLAAILAHATNLGLGRMAAASHGVTRDKLIWTADAYIRPENHKAALAKIIGAHHALPIASTWGDGTSHPPIGSSSARPSAATLPERSTPATATIPALASTRMSPTSTGRTACASCRPPATRHPTCLTGCCTMGPPCGSGRTTPIPAVPRTTCSSCAPCWGSGSVRSYATCPTASSPPSSRPRPTRTWTAC
jgi:hypothetical protein